MYLRLTDDMGGCGDPEIGLSFKEVSLQKGGFVFIARWNDNPLEDEICYSPKDSEKIMFTRYSQSQGKPQCSREIWLGRIHIWIEYHTKKALKKNHDIVEVSRFTLKGIIKETFNTKD